MKLLSGRKLAILLIPSITTIVLDQWTKQLVLQKFQWGESVSVIESFFALTYVRNTGAAFGFMQNAPSYFRDPFFIVVPVVALFIIFFVFLRLKKEQVYTATALSLILGGAIGNLIDRVRFGYVVDFLDFHWKEVYHWPAFNVADSCIVVGVSFLFISSFFQEKSQNVLLS